VLRAYVAAYGTATPATHLLVDGFALGRWVARCREQFRVGVLEAERAAVLEAVPGWSWGRTQPGQVRGGPDPPADLRHPPRRRQAQVSGDLRAEWAAVLEALPGWRWLPLRPAQQHRAAPGEQVPHQPKLPVVQHRHRRARRAPHQVRGGLHLHLQLAVDLGDGDGDDPEPRQSQRQRRRVLIVCACCTDSGQRSYPQSPPGASVSVLLVEHES